MELTAKQREILEELDSALRSNPQGTRITPLLLGGRDGSQHSNTLAALCKKGFVTRRKWSMSCVCKCGPDAQFGHRCKGSFSYDITPQGKEALQMTDSQKTPGVRILRSNLDPAQYPGINIQVPTTVIVVNPSTVTDDDWRSIGIEPLTEDEKRRITEESMAWLSDPSRLIILDEAWCLIDGLRQGKE
jgi:hypothetical protein